MVARKSVVGSPSNITVTAGVFREGVRDLPAWLVILDDVVPPQAASARPTPLGRSVTRVVVDAENGIVLALTFAAGMP